MNYKFQKQGWVAGRAPAEEVEYEFMVPIKCVFSHRLGNVTYDIPAQAWFHTTVCSWLGPAYAEHAAWTQAEEAGHELDYSRAIQLK